MLMKRLMLGTVLAVATTGVASATPITGSFSLLSFSGSYVGGSQTAATATGLDFGDTLVGGGGNGYGTNGTAFVGNTSGSFTALSGTLASIADISLGATANPYTSNPYISFGSNSPIVINFTDASLTRSPLGTSVTITGNATFTDGNPADTTLGTFSLSTSSQDGKAGSANFTFTSNVGATAAATPEPSSIALLGTGLLSVAGVIRRRFV